MEVTPTNSTDPASRLGPKLNSITNSFRRIADESTQELGITGTQSFLLGYLHCLEDRPLLDRMAERGLVYFREDETDRRRKRILLTDKGAEAVRRTKDRLDELDARLCQGFTPQELATLNALLDRVVENAKAAGGKCRQQEGE